MLNSTSWIKAERARGGKPTMWVNPRNTSRKRDGAAMLTNACVRNPNCTASIALAPPMEWPTTAYSGGSSAAASSMARANSSTWASRPGERPWAGPSRAITE